MLMVLVGAELNAELLRRHDLLAEGSDDNQAEGISQRTLRVRDAAETSRRI
jgi:hypothetical protein